MGSTVEDPDVVAKRMEIANSKSVSELSQVRSFSDFPIPENIERLMSRSATNHAEPAELPVQRWTEVRQNLAHLCVAIGGNVGDCTWHIGGVN